MTSTQEMSLRSRNELTVLGYVHELIAKKAIKDNVPLAIISVIIDYYSILFAWNMNEGEYNEDCWEWNEATPTTITKAHSTSAPYPVIYVKDEISIDSCHPKSQTKEFDFEITVDKKLERFVYFFVGFVSAELPMSFLKQKLGTYPSSSWAVPNGKHALLPCSVFVSSGYTHGMIYGRDGNNTKITYANNTDTEFGFDAGDRFCLRFNFIDMTCAWYYNGEFVNIVYRDIAPKLRLFLNATQKQQFSCTKFRSV